VTACDGTPASTPGRAPGQTPAVAPATSAPASLGATPTWRRGVGRRRGRASPAGRRRWRMGGAGSMAGRVPARGRRRGSPIWPPPTRRTERTRRPSGQSSGTSGRLPSAAGCWLPPGGCVRICRPTWRRGWLPCRRNCGRRRTTRRSRIRKSRQRPYGPGDGTRGGGSWRGRVRRCADGRRSWRPHGRSGRHWRRGGRRLARRGWSSGRCWRRVGRLESQNATKTLWTACRALAVTVALVGTVVVRRGSRRRRTGQVRGRRPA
jgi:hypothetical protein